jgi:glycosyltransferase involved in cell wall biosynthesis
MKLDPACLEFSVVMAAHRADAHLEQALASVEAALSASDAELIIVANGPQRDLVAELVRARRLRDSTRVETSALPSLAYCLNRGIELARGAYIARFDADDICLPDRFERQLRLAADSGADFLFSAATLIDGEGLPQGEIRPSTATLWQRCGPIHPTAFIRREALLQLGGYGQLEFSEDYHLWLRASAQGYRLVVDPLPAIAYRVHAGQSTAARRLADMFATNAGLKLALGLRRKSAPLLLGAAFDLICHVYRSCRSAFS